MKIVLMSDPRVAAIPVQDCGEKLIDIRASGHPSASAWTRRSTASPASTASTTPSTPTSIEKRPSAQRRAQLVQHLHLADPRPSGQRRQRLIPPAIPPRSDARSSAIASNVRSE